MKNTIFIALCMGLTTTAAAQNKDSIVPRPQIPAYYWQTFLKEAGNSNSCKKDGFLTNRGFNAMTKQLFTRVIVGADGLPKEGTASALAIDNETSKIGGNVNFAPFKKKPILFNFGAAGITSSKQLQIFGNDEYRKGFSLSAGFNVKLRSSVSYYEDSCRKLVAIRSAGITSLISKINQHNQLDADSLKSLIQLQQDSLLPTSNYLSYQLNPDDIAALQRRLNTSISTFNFLSKYIIQTEPSAIHTQEAVAGQQGSFPSKTKSQIEALL